MQRINPTALLLVLAFASGLISLSLALPPTASQARAQDTGAISALLQSGAVTYNCGNQNTFCRADISRCQSAQRERMNWRRDCRADYERAFNECKSRIAPPRPNLNGPVSSAQLQQMRDRFYEQRCGHTRRGSNRCEIEIASCPGYNSCSQQLRQCIADNQAALDQQRWEREQAEAEARARADEEAARYARSAEPAPRPSRPSSRPRLTDSQRQSLQDRMENAIEIQRLTNERRDTGFRYARTGNLRGLERLFAEGLSSQSGDDNGNSLLHAAVRPHPAVQGSNLAVLEWLLDNGVSANTYNNARQTPLFAAMEHRIDQMDYHQFDGLAPSEPFTNEVLHLLVERAYAIPQEPGQGGLTLLHVAALDYDAALVEALLERGFPTDVKDDRGRTAYGVARLKSAELAALFPEHAEREALLNRPYEVRGEVQCTDLSQIPEGERGRYQALAARGAVQLCGAD